MHKMNARREMDNGADSIECNGPIGLVTHIPDRNSILRNETTIARANGGAGRSARLGELLTQYSPKKSTGSGDKHWHVKLTTYRSRR
jgi:hypothetical protein